jgi:tetratricopeptide (TPR) repeat protein
MRGHTYHVYLKDDPKAIANFTKVIELEPNKAFNYRIRSQVYMDAKVYDKAIADSTKAIELEPTANNYLHRGQIHNRFNQYDQAIADSTKAIELDPKKYAYSCRGQAYFGLKEFDKAIADSTKAIELDPKFTGGYISRVLSYYERHQPGDAERAKQDNQKIESLLKK